MLEAKNADRIGLLLSGGGARAAYQVGVLRAISELLPKNASNPFHIISGTSAGALNAASLACHAHRLRTGVKLLEHVWKNISSYKVYTPQSGKLLGSASIMLFASMRTKDTDVPISLLDNSPLLHLLQRVLKLDKIQRNIDRGLLDALSITTSSYNTGESVSFYQGMKGLSDWQGPHRIGRSGTISYSHLMASSALPVLFPAVKIDEQFYGDGAVRQLAPTSTPIHLGATRLLVIGVSGNRSNSPAGNTNAAAPSILQILGHILNSAFVDTLENDLEFLRDMNDVLDQLPQGVINSPKISAQKIELLEISPSKEINILAKQFYDELPKQMAKNIKPDSSSTLLSLILFEKGFCSALWKMGYEDALSKESKIRHFFRN
ncbi:MAG: patatin-like phospholipase family protein [Proteobacteria bacterium]|nr:patatin-like phospholipase family protein [Pseudomonadota bacterium]MDA1291782.1 patatin-like phospholipase family protein [Pseudomonadota bacterium]